MDIVDFISKYQKVLNNRIEDISVSITSGSITDIEDYRARVGEIQGVTFADGVITGVRNATSELFVHRNKATT